MGLDDNGVTLTPDAWAEWDLDTGVDFLLLVGDTNNTSSADFELDVGVELVGFDCVELNVVIKFFLQAENDSKRDLEATLVWVTSACLIIVSCVETGLSKEQFMYLHNSSKRGSPFFLTSLKHKKKCFKY